MEVLSVVSSVFGARCTVVVADDRSCVVVDPGVGVTAQVVAYVRANALTPVAVLATHGHVDHTWDAAELCAALDVPLHLHAADAYRLRDPFGTLGTLGAATHDSGGPLAQAIASTGLDPRAYVTPADVRTFGTERSAGRDEDVALELGGNRVVARHAPGHTEGSTLYLLEIDGEPVAFTGDVLFAGTIGRTDLPGGDDERMTATLKEVCGALDPATVVVPGHGPTTDIRTELARNPYL
ncbi:MBL fold metallo-hydrolase [Cellulomonas sp. PhB150]|uniref:MBL fold metallo-hydrolase n=1 Tax=Cellulomonas sp. PhB150 TaxID=2485188 RepID=UPI000F49F774|nr:MBL fold metallo-hydrolase [Cellulomonas sp. PhB150]ROS30732.1 glyoxylase-like metal-dependent hydrolase (beta-lactamase superfamily II) [Cellulomonas sp. PhB150]